MDLTEKRIEKVNNALLNVDKLISPMKVDSIYSNVTKGIYGKEWCVPNCGARLKANFT